MSQHLVFTDGNPFTSYPFSPRSQSDPYILLRRLLQRRKQRSDVFHDLGTVVEGGDGVVVVSLSCPAQHNVVHVGDDVRGPKAPDCTNPWSFHPETRNGEQRGEGGGVVQGRTT